MMGLVSENSQVSPFLLAFSNSSTNLGVVTATQIYDELMKMSVWYVPRKSKLFVERAPAVFYQSAVGVRGFAILSGVKDVSGLDRGILQRYGLDYLSVKLTLTEITTFDEPVKLAPIVESLSFVSNKKHWGQSVRQTPRIISVADFDTIISCSRRHVG